MVTIKEVAKLAGVSTSTVSRALSNKVFVEETTREKVLDAVRQLGYRPNLMAKGLKEGFSHTVALILPNILNPFFPKLVKCIESRALERDYSLVLCDSSGDEEQELRHLEKMKSHYVDGVFYISVADGGQRARTLRDAGMPLVVLNREFDAGVPCITNDNRNGTRTVVEYLISMGHRKIACLTAPVRSQHYVQRYQGCIDAFQKHGIDNYKKYMAKNIESVEEAYAATKKLLRKNDRPTAIFVFIDIAAIGVYSAVHDCGMSVPDDVSVAGFDNIPISAHMIPALTTYEHPVDEIARKGVDTLLAEIRGEKYTSETVEISGTLMKRKSVRNLRGG